MAQSVFRDTLFLVPYVILHVLKEMRKQSNYAQKNPGAVQCNVSHANGPVSYLSD